jgi:hypothetical protein
MATRLMEMDPGPAAEALVDQQPDEWLDAFASALHRLRAADGLRRILDVWGLTQADLARLWKVSRQAVGKWLASGVPASRVAAVADLAAATDLLEHYVEMDRIPAVVRRPAPALGGESLVDLLASGRTHRVLAACKAMFDFGAVQA